MRRKFLAILVIGLMLFAFASPAQAGFFCKDGKDGAPGPKGDQGDVGPAGADGADGVDGIDGADGVDGQDGNGYEQENKIGIGVDYIVYERGDETSSNLNNVSWLRSITLENRIDLNNDKPLKRGYEGYVVFTIRKAK